MHVGGVFYQMAQAVVYTPDNNNNLVELGHILSTLQSGELAEPLASFDSTIRRVASHQLDALDSPLIDDPVFRDRAKGLREQVDLFEQRHPDGVEVGALFQCDDGAWIEAGTEFHTSSFLAEPGRFDGPGPYKIGETDFVYLFDIFGMGTFALDTVVGQEGILAAICAHTEYCGIATVNKVDVTYRADPFDSEGRKFQLTHVVQVAVTFRVPGDGDLRGDGDLLYE